MPLSRAGVAFVVTVFASNCFRVAAAGDGDLSRTTPVPADQPIPIADFFRPPLWHDAKLNPSGTRVAGLVGRPGEDKYRLLVFDLASHTSRVVGGHGDFDVSNYAWLNDDRITFFVAGEKMYHIGMFVLDAVHFTEEHPLVQYAGATLVSIPRNHRLLPLVWLRHDALAHGEDLGVAVIDAEASGGPFVNLLGVGATPRAIEEVRQNMEKHIVRKFPRPMPGITYRYLANWNDDGLGFAFNSDGGNLVMYRYTSENIWVRCPIDLEETPILTHGDNPDELVALVQRESDRPRVVQILDAKTGKPGEVILADPDYEFDGGVYRDPVTRRRIGVGYERDGPKTVWFDERYRRVQAALDARFAGKVVRIVDGSEQGAKFLVAVYSDRQPVSYYFADMADLAVGLVGDSRPWIDPARMRPMQILKFKTRDGRKLDAYVTFPAGASKEHPVPLVVLPHGGPWVRDTWGFYGEVQFLASRGYAVLQPNYRGSPGYDWMFPPSDRWDFGKMHDDVTAATQTLLRSGVIDPSRIAIMGGSFGGYLALAGVTREPTLYRCAVCIDGVFDWEMLMNERKYYRYDEPWYDRQLRKLGDPKAQAEKYAEISPIRHVSAVRVPVFVAHGKEDQVVEIGESKRLIAELEKYRVPHEQYFASGEGHGMRHLAKQVELYTRIEAFLAQNLAPAPSATR